MINEKHHAFVICRYYFNFLRLLGEKRGKDVFCLASRCYGEQRGRRMALRALRDGRTLNFESYFAYREWAGTPGASEGTQEAAPGCVTQRVTRCPWAELFREENAVDCGETYCAEIDQSLVRGFCKDMTLELDGTQHRHGACTFYFRSAELDAGTPERAASMASPDFVRPMAYHVAHLWKVFSGVCADVLGADGGAVNAQVRKDFAARWGDCALAEVDAWSEVDFTRLG